jgi:hypothetical protein
MLEQEFGNGSVITWPCFSPDGSVPAVVGALLKECKPVEGDEFELRRTERKAGGHNDPDVLVVHKFGSKQQLTDFVTQVVNTASEDVGDYSCIFIMRSRRECHAMPTWKCPSDDYCPTCRL